MQSFLEQGALGRIKGTDLLDATAKQYLESMSALRIVEIGDGGSDVGINHDDPPVWLERLEIGAEYVPEDRDVMDGALELLSGSPHLEEISRERRDGCHDAFGQVLDQGGHDGVAAASI